MMGFGDAVAQYAPRRQITTPVPHHSIFAGRVLFLTPNQQCKITEGKALKAVDCRHRH